MSEALGEDWGDSKARAKGALDAPASGNKHAGVPITAGELTDPACWVKDVGLPTTGELAAPACWVKDVGLPTTGELAAPA